MLRSDDDVDDDHAAPLPESGWNGVTLNHEQVSVSEVQGHDLHGYWSG